MKSVTFTRSPQGKIADRIDTIGGDVEANNGPKGRVSVRSFSNRPPLVAEEPAPEIAREEAPELQKQAQVHGEAAEVIEFETGAPPMSGPADVEEKPSDTTTGDGPADEEAWYPRPDAVCIELFRGGSGDVEDPEYGTVEYTPEIEDYKRALQLRGADDPSHEDHVADLDDLTDLYVPVLDDGGSYPKLAWAGVNAIGGSNHSFRFYPVDATHGNITKGLFLYQYESRAITVCAGMTGSDPWEITISATATHWWIKCDTTTDPMTVDWENGISFPEEWGVYPVLEFTDSGDSKSCINHQSGDIHMIIPEPETNRHVLEVTEDLDAAWGYTRGNPASP